MMSTRHPNKILDERMAQRAAEQREAEEKAKEEAKTAGRKYVKPKFKDGSKSSFKPSKVREIPKGTPFVMLSAPALSALLERPPSRRGFQMLLRLALEHLAHAGAENGHLVVTHRQFTKEARISDRFVGPTKEELIELGWLVVEHDGRYRGGAKRDPNRYRLTCFKSKSDAATGAPVYFEPTHEWQDVKEKPRRTASQNQSEWFMRVKQPATIRVKQANPEPESAKSPETEEISQILIIKPGRLR